MNKGERGLVFLPVPVINQGVKLVNLKKIFKISVITVAVIFAIGAYGDWTLIGSGCLPDYGESNIVVDKNNRIHIIWERPPKGDDSCYIFYRRSLDGGKTWQQSTVVAVPGFDFSIATDGKDKLYLIYGSWGPVVQCFRRSTDGGNIWSNPETLSAVYPNNTIENIFPNIAAVGDTVYTVWVATSSNFAFLDTLFFRRSVDGGVTWEDRTPLAVDTLFKPLIAASGKYVHVFYGCFSGDRYLRSADCGSHWSKPVLVGGPATAMAASGDHAYLSFGPMGAAHKPKIFYFNTNWKESRWDTLELPLMGDEVKLGQGPVIAANGNQLAVSWEEIRATGDTTAKDDSVFFYVAGSADSGRHWLPPVLLTIVPDSLIGVGACPRLALDDSGYVYILGYGEVGGKKGIVFMKIKLFSEAVEEKENRHSFFLSPQPNPAGENIEIKFFIPNSSRVTLQIYDLSGRLVRTLMNEQKGENSYAVLWNRRDNIGKKVRSGVYLCWLKIGDYTTTRKIVLMDRKE